MHSYLKTFTQDSDIVNYGSNIEFNFTDVHKALFVLFANIAKNFSEIFIVILFLICKSSFLLNNEFALQSI